MDLDVMQNPMPSHGALGWCSGRCAMPVRTFISAELGRLRKTALVQSKVQGTASTLSGMHRALGHERPDRHARGIYCRAHATSVPAAMIHGGGTHSPTTPTVVFFPGDDIAQTGAGGVSRMRQARSNSLTPLFVPPCFSIARDQTVRVQLTRRALLRIALVVRARGFDPFAERPCWRGGYGRAGLSTGCCGEEE